ncbi:hypothetical protein CKO11_03270 [Rhodobacter sp. TJ_12]|uniref:surface lipoprotein assembly modifier n=1 Tax=Rhodobacter sp. TJ_12 TaxID=2029399 RepID=UPI001CBE42A6|nr:tetratricopeptide repeat protein [Rhodobacter sp. TJ_12]MBZ4021484.1 hypothetical protein [Rhodobacter sp. TJ_12]
MWAMRCGAGRRLGLVQQPLRAALLVLGLTSVAGGALADPVRLPPDQAQMEAIRQLEAGRPEIAQGLAKALLQRDPNTFSAHLLLSYAARDLGQFTDARLAARRALALADGDAQRHDAMLALAQAQASAGRRTIAQLWLRRAIDVAPDPATRARDLRDFRYVRARNPWTFTLDAGLASSSNINGGTETDTIWLYGLPFTLSGDAQALSGQQTHGSLSVQRTVSETDHHRVRLGFNLAGQDYRLSDAAKQLAPTAKGSDYAFWAVETYVIGQMRAGRGRDEWDMRLLAGHNDYSGQPLSNYASLALGRSIGIDRRTRMHLGASVERQWRQDTARKSAVLRFADLELQRGIGRIGSASLGLRLGEVDSASADVAHIRKGISLGLDLARPVFGAEVSLNASYERRDYGLLALSTDERTDHRITLGADALLRDHAVMGFAPEIGLGYTQNRSNWALSDSHGLNLSMRIKSAF